MFEFLLYGLFVIGYGIVAQGQGFPDPIANIRPVGRPQRERTNQQTNAWEDDAESQWVSEKSLANKRNADKNLLVDSSTLQNEQVVSEEEEGEKMQLKFIDKLLRSFCFFVGLRKFGLVASKKLVKSIIRNWHKGLKFVKNIAGISHKYRGSQTSILSKK